MTESEAGRALSLPKKEIRKLVVRGDLHGRIVADRIIVSVKSIHQFVQSDDGVHLGARVDASRIASLKSSVDAIYKTLGQLVPG